MICVVIRRFNIISFCFFFNDTATTEIYTLSYTTLFRSRCGPASGTGTSRPSPPRRSPTARRRPSRPARRRSRRPRPPPSRSEEHTSELQSRQYLVCRLLLEKKKYKNQEVYILRHK